MNGVRHTRHDPADEPGRRELIMLTRDAEGDY